MKMSEECPGGVKPHCAVKSPVRGGFRGPNVNKAQTAQNVRRQGPVTKEDWREGQLTIMRRRTNAGHLHMV